MFSRIGIRTRISGGSLLIAILISIAAGIVINTQVERIVREGTISVLRSDSASYIVALQNEPGENFDAPGRSQLIAVVAPDGTTPVDTLPASLSVRLPELTRDDETRQVDADGSPYLVRAADVEIAGDTWYVVAARSADEETTVLSQMRVLLIGGLSFIALGVGVTAWVLTSASLGPVRRLRTSAEALTATDTDELLPVGRADDEITRLARTLNGLIEKLRSSADRERQLVSDASHELRTPLAILKTQLELARTEASSIDQLVDDVHAAERSADRLSRLVTSLLELSAIDAASTVGSATSSELEDEVADAVERARFRAGDAVSILFERAPDRSARVLWPIRAEDFGRIVDNLLGNSLVAMAGAGEISVRFTASSAGASLLVSDSGGGLDPDFVPHALDRFSRADESRAHGSGVGLGLAIVAAILKNAEGRIQFDNRPGIGLDVLIELDATTELHAADGTPA